MTSERKHELLLNCTFAGGKGLKPSSVGREGSVPQKARLCLRWAVTPACAVGLQTPTVPVVGSISVWGAKRHSQGGENRYSCFGC